MCVLHIMGNIQLRLSFDLAISLPEICAKELYEQMCKKKKKISTRICIAAKNWKQPKCPLMPD